MKLNLECATSQIQNGYINTSIQPIDGVENVVLCDYKNIDNICGDDDAEEIIVNPPLNVLLPTDLVQVLQHWGKKLNSEGVLKISFFDIRVIGKLIAEGTTDLQKTHMMILGPQNEFSSILDLPTLKKAAQAVKLNINGVRFPTQAQVSVELTKL